LPKRANHNLFELAAISDWKISLSVNFNFSLLMSLKTSLATLRDFQEVIFVFESFEQLTEPQLYFPNEGLLTEVYWPGIGRIVMPTEQPSTFERS
jgi:hypothetical protein